MTTYDEAIAAAGEAAAQADLALAERTQAPVPTARASRPNRAAAANHPSGRVKTTSKSA